MKKIGMLLLISVIVSGCASKNTIKDVGYTCQVDQKFNTLTIERGGKFAFPAAASRVQVFIFNNQINIVDFTDFEYTGYILERNNEDKKIQKMNNFDVVVNKGDFYFEGSKMVEIFSPQQRTFSLYYFAPNSNNISSIQFLTDCEQTDLRYKRAAHSDDAHTHSGDEHPLLRKSDTPVPLS